MAVSCLSIDHYDEILSLWIEAGLESIKPNGRDSREFLKKRMDDSATWILGISDNESGSLVGVVIASHDGQRGWINRLAVHPSQRRKGYGKKLIRAAEDLLENEGIQLWAGLIEESSIESHQLFQNAGYKRHENVTYYSRRESQDY